jgi:hypothetical protein
MAAAARRQWAKEMMRPPRMNRFSMHPQNMDKGDATPCVHDIKFSKTTLKQSPPIVDRVPKDMGRTTAKRPRQWEPPDAA